MKKILQYLQDKNPYAVPIAIWYATPWIITIAASLFFGGLGFIIGSLLTMGFTFLSVTEALHVGFAQAWEGYADWKRESN